MSSLDNMGNASNERKLQNIMRLQRAFKNGQVVTIQSAMNLFGVTKPTMVRWAKEGQVPLYDPEKQKTVLE